MAESQLPRRRALAVATLALFAGAATLGLASEPAQAAVSGDGLACGPIIQDDIYGRYCITESGFMKLYSHYDGRFLGYTHGGDPVPLDVDPFASGDPGPSDGAEVRGAPQLSGSGYTAGARDPHCVTSDSPYPEYYAHVIYVRYKNEPDTYNDNAEPIRQMIRETNGLMWDTTAELGRTLQYKVLCDSNGEIKVSEAVLPNNCGAADCFNDISAQLINLGYNDPKVKYWVWTENTACSCGGKGNMYPDTTPGLANKNNGNVGTPMFAVTFKGIKGVRVMMHENGHNMGAVQSQAGGANGANNQGHCWDGTDIMCYGEPGEAKPYNANVCPGSDVWDCNADSYCNPKPQAGSFLASNWNICTLLNRYLVAGNGAPDVGDDAATVNEDSPTVRLDVLDNDSDPDPGDELYFHSITAPVSGGEAKWNATLGMIEYRPGKDFFGTDSFSYQLRDREDPLDGTVMKGTGKVTINVVAVNDPPTADELPGLITKEDTPLALTVTGSDVEGSPVTFTLVQGPKHGKLLGTLPSVTYRPDDNWYGWDGFTFRTSDGLLQSQPRNVPIFVRSINDVPNAVDDETLAFQDVPDWPIEVLANDNVDPDDILADDNTDDEHFSIDHIYSLTHGVLRTEAGGILKLDAGPVDTGPAKGEDDLVLYTPPAGFKGLDKFWYRICDTDGSVVKAEDKKPLCKEAQVDIEVVDSDLVAFPDAYETSEDTTLWLPAEQAVLYTGKPSPFKDVWPGKDDNGVRDVRVVVEAQPAYGSVAFTDDGAMTYEPDADFYGRDQFRYKIRYTFVDTDGLTKQRFSNVALVNINVLSVNDPPVADSQEITLDEDALAPVALTGSDLEDGIAGLPLSFAVSQPPRFGTLTGSGASLAYRPMAEFSGTDSFRFRVTDSLGAQSEGVVKLIVNGINDPPIALPDFYLVRPDQANRVLAEEGVLINDDDFDGDPLRAELVRSPDHGDVVVAEDGSFRYVPDAGFVGIDTFSYIAIDVKEASSHVVPVRLEVAFNQPPMADFTLVRPDGSMPEVVEAEDVVLFKDRSVDLDGPILRYQWDFGDGNVQMTRDAEHRFASPGNYEVTHSVWDEDGARADATRMLLVVAEYDTETGGDYTLPAPVARATGPAGVEGPLTVLAGGLVELVGSADKPVTQWQWRQVSGQPVQLRHYQASNATFLAPALLEGEIKRILAFELTVFDGFRQSMPVRIEVHVHSPEQTDLLEVDGGPDVTTFTGETVTLTAGSTTAGAAFAWRQMAGGDVHLKSKGATATFQAPYATVQQQYVFEVTAAASGLTSMPDRVRVTVLPGLVPSGIDALAVGKRMQVQAVQSGPAPDGVRLEWDFGDGTTAKGLRADHEYAEPGTYDVRLTVSNDQGYERVHQRTVVVQEQADGPLTLQDAPSQAGGPSAAMMVAVAAGILALLGAAGYGLRAFLRRR